jgi:SAM-dependent methyltransferase
MAQTASTCRFCRTALRHIFVDLGMSPLCESYVTNDTLDDVESFYSLKALVCDQCFLVQVEDHVMGEPIFGEEYAYFSSFSDSWLQHAKNYVEMITERLALDQKSQVVELASNDGYLLKNFVARGIPVLGVEPSDNTAEVAVGLGVPTLVKFFGTATARELVADGKTADLLIGNNVLAHVPDLNDFVAGMKLLLAPAGVITMEFPHLVHLIEGNQFDTIYQEHYSYFSLYTVRKVLAEHGLTIFDVEELPTHGGSLRIYAGHADRDRPVTSAVTGLAEREITAGITSLSTYEAFGQRVVETKHRLLEFLIGVKREGKSIVGYGAPGKGNTLLNYCGIRQDFIDYVVDRNPYKHGKYLPGTHIPIHPPERINETRPDYILILPWNLKDEIVTQLAEVREWGAKFVVPIPELQVLS